MTFNLWYWCTCPLVNTETWHKCLGVYIDLGLDYRCPGVYWPLTSVSGISTFDVCYRFSGVYNDLCPGVYIDLWPHSVTGALESDYPVDEEILKAESYPQYKPPPEPATDALASSVTDSGIGGITLVQCATGGAAGSPTGSPVGSPPKSGTHGHNYTVQIT